MKVSFSAFNFPSSLLAGTATITAVLFSQGTVFALTDAQRSQIGAAVYKIANPATVQINYLKGGADPNDSKSPEGLGGSGVIIKREGNTYTVLTCLHVVAYEKSGNQRPRLTVRTFDNLKPGSPVYEVTSVTKLGDVVESDLAIVTFTTGNSEKTYPEVKVAETANQAENNALIFVSGYPAIQGKSGSQRPYRFADGVVTKRLNVGSPPGFEPYTMRYDAQTEVGMSGGAVFDKDGRVIAIHGMSGAIGLADGFSMRSGDRNGAVPINIFWEKKSKYGLGKLDIKRDNAPSTDNPSERLKNPDSGFDWEKKGAVEAAQGNKEEAVKSFNEAIERDPSRANAFLQRGNIRFDQEDWQGAIADYDRAITLNPDYTNAYYNRAAARWNQRDKEGALADFNEYLTRSPNDFEAFFQRGKIRNSLGDTEGMLADFDRVVALVPEEPRAYYNRGVVRRQLQDWPGAIEDLQKAVDLLKQQGMRDEDDRRFYQKAQQLIQSLQPTDGAATPQPPEPVDNSGDVTPDNSGNQQPEPADDSDVRVNPDEPATPQSQPGGDSGW
ncbi:serine protease [Planktothrix sp. FACHB-1355]|uniref:Serine protease n=1 Tax=Aerosakkonema funiforme FACHB-1375 TaxID=2949571 RepID=A0A926VH30_9CYAN|nr:MULTISPECIES: tetratricopeptide repeat-containing serine protease family protein [Oscillatoriales]MBD2183766.1 serine protease [Aerosakkonema funiforme FACHB-1375]MBD3559184.1 serine protease [Planktothrix sp. FACHB-1355]